MPLLLTWGCLGWSGFVLFLLITAIMRGRGKIVVLCISNGDEEQSLPLEEVLLVVLVVVEEVKRWCRCWCVCCHHLSLPLHLPDFGICGQFMRLWSLTTTMSPLPRRRNN
eukprot:15355764-Ditylum_brightwellii.AAC.1